MTSSNLDFHILDGIHCKRHKIANITNVPGVAKQTPNKSRK